MKAQRMAPGELMGMSRAIRCPSCGYALVTFDLPERSWPTAEPQSPLSPMLLRIGDAARLLGIGRSTMYQLVASRTIPVIRIGRSVRVSRAVLDAWVRAET
jgi:excisionase family DNA binding protein